MNKSLRIVAGIIVLAGVGGVVYTTQHTSRDDSIPDYNSILVTPTQETTRTMQEPTSYEKYVAYTKAAFDAAQGKKRVYFFHAAWCPECKEADADFTNNMANIPEDVVVFKTDYDTQKALKQQYAVVYQHTFVQVDDTGALVTTWNGGGVEELNAKIQ